MNIITFDIEEWYIEKVYHNGRNEDYQKFDLLLSSILDMLDAKHIKATFFCVGGMSTFFPNVIKRLYERGHEIGCHSNSHKWLTTMNSGEVERDTREAIDSLEQLIGNKVTSYRAPAFSICDGNTDVFETLVKCGISIDASVFPATRDFGGFPSFPQDSPTLINTGCGTLKEFPITMTHFLNHKMAFSGGGYFRFFPLPYISHIIDNRNYNIFYFHIGDLLSTDKRFLSRKEYEEYFSEDGTLPRRLMRYAKSNIGTSGAYIKLQKLIAKYDYINISTAADMIDWSNVRHLTL